MHVDFTLHAVQENAREVDEAGFDAVQLAEKHIIGDGGGDGHAEADGRGNEGFGNAGGHGGKRGGFHLADGVERSHDAPDRTEQTDERRSVGGGGQNGKMFVQTVDFKAYALIERATHGFDNHAFIGAGFLAVVEFTHTVLSHAVKRRSGITAEALHGLTKVGGVREADDAGRGLAFGGGQRDDLAYDDGPAEDGKRNEDDHDELGDETCAGKDGKNVVVHGCSEDIR